MNKSERFVFRLTKNDRESISDLAARLRCSRSAAVRFVVVEASRRLSETNRPAPVAHPIQQPEQGELSR